VKKLANKLEYELEKSINKNWSTNWRKSKTKSMPKLDYKGKSGGSGCQKQVKILERKIGVQIEVKGSQENWENQRKELKRIW
jgi:hypothetical protein